MEFLKCILQSYTYTNDLFDLYSKLNPHQNKAASDIIVIMGLGLSNRARQTRQ